MKTYIITWTSNYGLGVCIIYANSLDNMHKLCKESDQIWNPYSWIELIPEEAKEGIFHLEQS